MLTPKKVKHRKWRKRTTSKGIEARSTTVDFGSYGLKSLGEKWITSRQIEAARRAIIRYLRKVVSSGLEYFHTSQLLKKEQKCLWVEGKELLIIMFSQSDQVE